MLERLGDEFEATLRLATVWQNWRTGRFTDSDSSEGQVVTGRKPGPGGQCTIRFVRLRSIAAAVVLLIVACGNKESKPGSEGAETTAPTVAQPKDAPIDAGAPARPDKPAIEVVLKSSLEDFVAVGSGLAFFDCPVLKMFSGICDDIGDRPYGMAAHPFGDR